MKPLNSKNIIKKLSAVLLVVVGTVSFICAPVTAASKSKLRSQRTQLQQQIAEAQKNLKELKSQSADKLLYLDALEAKIKLMEEQTSSLETQIADVQKQISDLENQITSLQEQYDKMFAEYCERVRAMYVSGGVTELEIMMSAGDMSEFFVRSEMLQKMSAKDGEILDGLIKSMQEIETKKTELNDQKVTLDDSLKELSESRETLQADEDEVKAAIAELEAQADKYSEDMAANQEELNKVNSELEYDAGSFGGSIVNGTGQFTHPCPGYRTISAGYPNYASGSYHGGVDFSASTGTPIYAADSGTVVSVKYLNYSYGYHLMIAHGNNLYTLYAHTSAIYVSVGQNVTKGQKIAAVGSTGNSSGSHLHFEVRAGGSRYKVNNVNPLAYL